MKKAGLFIAAIALFGAIGSAWAGDSNLIPNRLSYAKVGEWAQYELPDGYTQRLTVAKRYGEGPDALVTILVENIYDGKVVTAQEITEMAGDPFASPRVPTTKGVLVAVRNEVVPFKGKSVPVSVVEVNKHLGTEDQEVTEYHTNSEVPVFGIFKKIENGETVWKLDDFGQGDGTFTRSPEVDKALKDAYEARLKEEEESIGAKIGKAVGAAAKVGTDAANEIKQIAEDALKKAGIAVSAPAAATSGSTVAPTGPAAVVGDATRKTEDALRKTGAALTAEAELEASAIDKAVGAIKGAAGATTSTVGGLLEQAKDAISDSTKAAGKALGSAAGKVSDEVKAETKAIGDALGKTESAAEKQAAETDRAIEKALQSIKSSSQKEVGTAKQAADKAVKTVKGAAQDDAEATKQMLDKAIQSIKNM